MDAGIPPVESCMGCHNGALRENYTGHGLQNPHPFPGARFISCEVCHGGDPTADEPDAAHVPRPPEIGTLSDWSSVPQDAYARFTADGREYLATAIPLDGTGASLVLSRPLDEALGPFEDAKRTIVWIAFAVMALALVGSQRLADRICQGCESLVRDADQAEMPV